MTIMTITVENEKQKNKIINVLNKAEINGELDFAFNVHSRPVIIGKERK